MVCLGVWTREIGFARTGKGGGKGKGEIWMMGKSYSARLEKGPFIIYCLFFLFLLLKSYLSVDKE